MLRQNELGIYRLLGISIFFLLVVTPLSLKAFRLNSSNAKSHHPDTLPVQESPLVVLSHNLDDDPLKFALSQLLQVLDRQQDDHHTPVEVLTKPVKKDSNSVLSSSLSSSSPAKNPGVKMSTIVSLTFTSLAFFLVLVVFYQFKANHQAHVTGLHKEYKHLLDNFQVKIKSQLESFDLAAINRETDTLRAEISSLRRGVNRNFDQRGEIEKAAMGISQLWSEVYRLRHDTTSAIIDYSTGTTINSTANNSNSGASQPQLTNNRSLVPSSIRLNGQTQNSDSGFGGGSSFGAISKTAFKSPSTKARKTNLLKTEFGTFDISTSEGRQQWIKAMNEFNATKKPSPGFISQPTSSDSIGSAMDSAKIEFIIPKSDSNRSRPQVGTENVDVKAAVIEHKPLTKTSGSTVIIPDASPEPIVPLTLEEIKAKLDESVQKNYRRVFIPGRGWVSLRKLQEEAEALGNPATA